MIKLWSHMYEIVVRSFNVVSTMLVPTYSLLHIEL